ncbi:hypothetical protein Droror1_Dr00000251 [Drosera rotundifolia]
MAASSNPFDQLKDDDASLSMDEQLGGRAVGGCEDGAAVGSLLFQRSRFAPDFSTARVLVPLSSPQRRVFSPFKSLLSLSSSSSLLALLLPPPHLASSVVPIGGASKTMLEDDEQWLRFPGFSISGVWISRLALLLSGLEDDEQWLGFLGPPFLRCSSGFSPPPEGCLISSSSFGGGYE